MANIYITTTGATPSVILSDLGYRVFTHPTIDYNIGSEFTYTELQTSTDFNNSLNFGYITASYNGTIVTTSSGFEPVVGGRGATGPQGATGATGSQGIQGPTGSAIFNGLTSSTQFLTASNDTNVTLNIVSSGSTHSFNMGWNGVLPVTRGGTGTASLFTQGSIIFAGGGGQYFQDNPNLFWNDPLNRLAIGTNSTATASLTVTDGIQVGFGLTSGTIAATNELVLRQDGDVFGPSILRLRNRNGENGAIYETTDSSITLVDFIFKSAINQRNIRFESRTASTFLGISPEFQFGPAANPTLVVSDREVNVRGTFSISNTTKTFEYQFVPSSITGDRRINLPLLSSDDTLVTSSASQILTNKEISGGTISGVTISSSTILSSNSIIEATRLQTFTISSATPSTNNILSWNGSSWTPISNNIVGATGATGPSVALTSYGLTYGATAAITTTTTTFPNQIPDMLITGLTAGNYYVFFGGHISNNTNGGTTTFRIYLNNTTIVSGSDMVQTRGKQALGTIHGYSAFPVTLATAATVSVHWIVNAGTTTLTNRYMSIVRR